MKSAPAPLCCQLYTLHSQTNHLTVVGDSQTLSAGNFLKVDTPSGSGARDAEAVAQAGFAGGGVDGRPLGLVLVGREIDGAEEVEVVGVSLEGISGLGEPVEGEDVDGGGAGAGDGGAGGEDGLEMAAVGAGGDVVEADENVAALEGAVVVVECDLDGHAVGRGRRVGLRDGVDEGREDGAAGTGHEVLGAGWGGGGEESAGQESRGDGECVHFGCEGW